MGKIKRLPHRADYSLETAYKILDSNTLCHIAFIDNNCPVSIPMAYWRIENFIYFHAGNKGRIEKCTIGQNICISIASVTGLVLARSAFEHTYNYESVVIHGVPESVENIEEKKQALKIFVENLYPTRWQALKPITDSELKATKVIRLEIKDFACKVRNTSPDDGEEDGDIPVWAGQIPIHHVIGSPIQDGTMQIDFRNYLDNLKKFEK